MHKGKTYFYDDTTKELLHTMAQPLILDCKSSAYEYIRLESASENKPEQKLYQIMSQTKIITISGNIIIKYYVQLIKKYEVDGFE